MSVSIDIRGIPELTRFLKNKNKNTKSRVKTGMIKSAVFLQGEVKESIAGRKAEHRSVDTGRFLNSVGFQASDVEANVFSNLEYARRLEFGTDFKNSPRKHFRNSADRSKQKIREIISKEVKKI